MLLPLPAAALPESLLRLGARMAACVHARVCMYAHAHEHTKKHTCIYMPSTCMRGVLA